MADEKPLSTSDRDDTDMLATMRSRLSAAMGKYSRTRQDQLQDLKFFAGTPDNQWQWSQADIQARTAQSGGSARPVLTINKIVQHVRQVTNDQRQNRPSAKVIPNDGEGDVQLAEMLNGIIRHIEYISDADVAYDTACEAQVVMGEGFIRLLTQYTSDDSFDLDIRIKRVRNSFSVYLDPMMEDPCGQDAEWGFVTSEMTKTEYERTWPDKQTISQLDLTALGDPGLQEWTDEKTIRIVEYFYASYRKTKLHLFDDGSTAFEGSDEAKQMQALGMMPIKTRDALDRTIHWVKSNGAEVLEEQVWPGKWIPIIRVVGNEVEVEGELHVSGLVRNTKDAQRQYNYWASQEAELLALAPKAPFIGYAGQFQGFEKKWANANTSNYPYLEVNPDVTDSKGAVLPLPQRSQPPGVQSGLIAAKQAATDDIKAVTGQYNASIGETSNERSGKAINARERQADTGTYHYVDNLARAVRFIARQCVDLIPKIYDTKRVARIIGLDGEVGTAQIDPTMPQAVNEIKDENGAVIKKIYNPAIGTYDVMVSTGPGYMSKRQEALDAMSEILKANPDLWAVAGDLFIKNMDWPGAQEMAERFKKVLNPAVLSEQSPQVMELQKQIEALTQELNLTSQTIVDYKKSSDAQKANIDAFAAQVKAFEAETKRLALLKDVDSNDERIHQMILGMIDAAMSANDLNAGLANMQQENESDEAHEQEPMDPNQAPGGQAPPGQAPGGMPAPGGAAPINPNPAAQPGSAGGM